MVDGRNSSLTRRRLLGTSVGVGAASLLTRSVGASPFRSGAPYIKRSQDKAKITYWGQSPELLDPFKKMVEDFNKTNPNIEVEISMTPTDQWKAKINTALSAGSGPDIWAAFSRPQLDIDIKSGLIADLTGQIDLT